MKKEFVISICGVLFLAMLAMALFNNKNVQDSAENTLHEITTFDLWKQTAYTPAAYCPTYPQQGQGYYAGQAGSMQQAATAAPVALAVPIPAGAQAPVLVKEMGMEVVPVTGGKVKISGVMGSSWADKAGLKAGDILLSFDTKKITSLKQFQGLLAAAPPEKDYKVVFLRGSAKKKCLVTVGEGEMEGFTPIVKPK